MELLIMLLVGLALAFVLSIAFICFLAAAIFTLPITLVIGGYWMDWLYDSIEHFFTYWRGGDNGLL